MAAEPGDEAERDPVQSFVDEAFEEMMREVGASHKGVGKYGKDPLTATLLESAAASLSHPASSGMSELEKILFVQALATALADALAPALAENLATEIMKNLERHNPQKSHHKEPNLSNRGGRSPQEGTRRVKGK
ncbi:hypothetical protein GCM10010211_21980 [Streptomyces albospinus]|uniref:Uncharacterized protein n=1 Tax=Streptomyces albospinus TaxID=285515 RepID=A0ABQ2UXR1_9ACTN|nr:hypothetical protein [Streptomyces albospinus]GGU56879.1 hypothetical protein GCM10010211_21980 [Streptomyces albospinus]